MECNRDLLVNAGILDPEAELSVEDQSAIEGLNPDDLQALIRVWNDLSPDFKERHIIGTRDLIF